MTSHVDTEVLALAAEGLLEGDEATFVQAHVADCAHCAEQQAALGEVTGILGAAPAPELPDSVAEQLSAAVLAEVAARRGDAASPPGAPATGTGQSAATAESDPPAPGSESVEAPEGNPNDTADQLRRARAQARAADPDGAAGAEVTPLRPRRTARWLPYLAAAAAAVFVIGGGAALFQGVLSGQQDSAGTAEAPGEGDEPAAIMPYQPLLTESGTPYTESGLQRQASEVLRAAGPSLPSPDSGKGAEEGAELPQGDSENITLTEPDEAPAALSSCIEGLPAADDVRPDLVDIATYAPADGDSVAAWVLFSPTGPSADDRSSYQVTVIDASCSGPDADASVLAETAVQAP
ncbi:anti-sigma factor family protein [Nocardiopsis coralliicola]